MGNKPRTSLTPFDEQMFQNWYAKYQKIGGPYSTTDPNHPDLDYDYRAAFKAGAKPWYDKGNNVWMWPREFSDSYNPLQPNYEDQVTGSLFDEYDTQPNKLRDDGFMGGFRRLLDSHRK